MLFLVLTTAEREQGMVLANAKAVDTFIQGIDIENRNDNKENINHFLLQYDVNEDTCELYSDECK